MNYGRCIANRDIRQEMKQAKIPLWLAAKYCGVGEATISRWLREPLPEEKRRVIVSAIQAIKAESAGGEVDAANS